jgi:Ni/Fe-hydrogenase subunit HybB-like protein
VEYNDLRKPVAWAFAAAFGGFIWAWFIHRQVAKPADYQQFLAALTLRMAVLLVAAVPVINAQVLTNPDWEGSLTQYITLATLAGAAAIALTPTFRVITSSPSASKRSASEPSASEPSASEPSASEPPEQAQD